jgi:hypothetical protein
MKNACGILVGNGEGKRPFLRPRRRWQNNIKMDLTEIGRKGVEGIDLTQDRDRGWNIVNIVTNLQVLIWLSSGL